MATVEWKNDAFLQYIRSCDNTCLLAETGAYEYIKYARLGKVGWSAGSVLATLGWSSIVAVPYAVWAGYESYKADKRYDDCVEQLLVRGLAHKEYSTARKTLVILWSPAKP